LQTIGDAKKISIEGAEAHHMLSVFRLQKGDRVVLFDGSGTEYQATITAHGRKSLEAEIISSREADREPPIEVALALSIPKAKRMDFAIQKCAELGLKTLIPMQAQRTVVRPKEKASHKTSRWQRIATEASKQSGRSRILEIAKLQQFEDIIAGCKEYDVRLLAALSEDARPLAQALRSHPQALRVIYMIGPEGGFTEDECEHARANDWESISLGKSILRVETAAIAALAMILYEYERDVGVQEPGNRSR
jgi:16S rRNA (uracil1498-N3)-methyltransferase